MGKNEVAVKEASLPSVDVADFYAGVEVASQDFLVPKLLPMQGMSDLVTDGKAAMGEFRDSVSGELKGHIDRPIDFIPFFARKSWDILQRGDTDKFEWQHQIPVIDNPLDKGFNGNWDPFEIVKMADKDGKLVDTKRVYRYDFFVLLPQDMAGGAVLPYVLSFKSTSLKAGKNLFMEIYTRNRAAKLLPWHYKFKLGGKREKNDQGTYIVLDVMKGDVCNDSEKALAMDWWQRLKTTAVRIDESDVQKSSAAESVDDAGVSAQF